MSDQELVKFAQSLIQTQSYSSKENKVAERIVAEMKSLGFDEAYIDECGNAIGFVKGKLPGKCILMDGHIDTVAANAADWKHPPFGGEIVDGILYGRGIVDMKGSLATMIYAAASVDREKLAGTIAVSGTVLEEHLEGVSLKFVVDRIKPDYVIIGEATNFQLNRAGRGRAEIIVETIGKSAHSASPQIGSCAVHAMTKVIEAIDALPQTVDPFVGATQMTLTDIISEPYPGFSVIPARCRVTYDRRTIPGETAESVLAPIKSLPVLQNQPHRIYLVEGKEICYTGKAIGSEKFFPAWKFSEDNPFVSAAIEALQAKGLEPKIGSYQFCTNAAYCAGHLSIPTIGFGPGDERLVHIADECLPVKDLILARDYFKAILENALKA